MEDPIKMAGDVPIMIPGESAAPDVGESLEEIPRDYVDLPPNLAENEEVAAAFLKAAQMYYQKFRHQGMRDTLRDNMQAADAMYRASKRRDRTQAVDQQQDTLSNVSSTSFYNSIRVTTAGQKAVMFYGDELPARFEPVPKSPDYTDEEGVRVARHQNALLKYYWEKGQYERALKDSLLFCNKYGQEVLCMEWDYRTQTCIERVPGYYTRGGKPVEFDPESALPGNMYDRSGNPIAEVVDSETGRPKHFVFIEKTRVVRDCPMLARIDLKDIFFDLEIDGFDEQQCVIHFSTAGLHDIYQGQRDGLYANAGKVGVDHLAGQRDEHDIEIKEDRADNAEDDFDVQDTGRFRLFHVWMRAPIDDRAGGKSAKRRGRWDRERLPVWYKATFAGNIDSGPCVCLELRRNPYHDDTLPYKLIHSHADDKGAVHLGYQNLLECLYEEETATINQMIDNKTLGVNKPWVGELGNVLSRNLKFKQGNQVFWVKPGSSSTALKQLDVGDMTGTTLPFLEWVRSVFDKTAGTDKAIAGEYAGSRTTGTEVLTVQQQAMKPALEDAEYMSDQYFPWLLRKFESLVRQFADPNKTHAITYETGVETVNPGDLYGQTDIRIVSIGQFESDVTMKQSLNNFIAAAYDKAAPFMGKQGGLEFWKTVFRMMKLPDSHRFFPGPNTREAENQAWTENQLAVNDPVAAMNDLPMPDENHEVHVRIHKEALTKLKYFTQGANPLSVQVLEGWIQMHEQMAQAQTPAVPTQALGALPPGADTPQNQADMVPGMPGEASGDMLAGPMAGGEGAGQVAV